MQPTRDDDELELELEAPLVAAPPVRPRPDSRQVVVAQIGDGPALDPAVYLDVRAIETMFVDAQRHQEYETGGLLIGELCQDAAGTYLRVISALPAGQTERSPVSVTFTHRAWNEMLAHKESLYPDHEVVGWYHTHPRMRVFLSAPDRFIHRSFFGRPHDIAIVLDLHKREWAVFRWHADCIEVAKQFFVYGANPSDGARIPGIIGQFAPFA